MSEELEQLSVTPEEEKASKAKYEEICKRCLINAQRIKDIVYPKVNLMWDAKTWITIDQFRSLTTLSYEQARQIISELMQFGFAEEMVIEDKFRYHVTTYDWERLKNLAKLMYFHKQQIIRQMAEVEEIKMMAFIIDPDSSIRTKYNIKFD